jgi:competence protein ComX
MNMQEIVQFLIQNPDVLEKVTNGTASLIGVNSDELQVIIDILTNKLSFRVDYWK